MVGKKKPLPPKGMINAKPTKFKKQKKQHGGDNFHAAHYNGDYKSDDFYELLGVARNASEADIIKAYRNGSLKFHTDKSKTEAGDIMAKLNEARDTLIDREKRKEYNKDNPPKDILTRASNVLNKHVANTVAVVTPATDKQQKGVTPAITEIHNAVPPVAVAEDVTSAIEPAAATKPSPIVAFIEPPLVFDSVELYMFLNILVHFIYINKDDDYRIPYFIKEVPIPLQSGALVTTTPFDINLLKTNIFADILREAQSAIKNSDITATTSVDNNVKKLKVFKNGLNLWVENNRSILRIKNINVITTSITNIVSNILLTKERPYKLIKSTFTIMDFLKKKKSDVKDSDNTSDNTPPPNNINDIKDIPALVTFLNETEYIKVTKKFVDDNETKLQVNIEEIEKLVNSTSKPSTKYTVDVTTDEPLGNLKILIEEVIKQVKASSYVEKTATIASTHPIIYNNLYWRNKRPEISTFLGNIYIRINGMERIRDYIDKKLKEANSKANEANEALKALEEASKKPSEVRVASEVREDSKKASEEAFNNFIKKINNEIELATKVTNAATASEDAERALYIYSIFITYVEVNRIINKTKKLKAKRLEIQQKLIKLYDNFKIEKPKPIIPQPRQTNDNDGGLDLSQIGTYIIDIDKFIENNTDDLKKYINTIKKEYVLNKNTKDAISTLRVVLTSTDSRITAYGAIKTITYSKQAESEFLPHLTKKMMQTFVKEDLRNDNLNKEQQQQIDSLFGSVIEKVLIVEDESLTIPKSFDVYSISQLQNKDEDTKIKEAFENVFNTDSYANTLKIKTVAEKVRVYAQNARISIAEAIKTFIEKNELKIENIISLTKISEQVAEKAIKAATDAVEFSTKKSEEEAKKSKMVKTKISTEKKDENEKINGAKVSLKKAQLEYDNEVKDAEHIYKIATLNKNTENVKKAKDKAEKVYKLATEVAEKATVLYVLLAKEAIKSPAKVAEAGATYADAVARYYSDNHESFDNMPDIASILKVIDTFKEILGDTYLPPNLNENYKNIHIEGKELAEKSYIKVTNQLKKITTFNVEIATARVTKAEAAKLAAAERLKTASDNKQKAEDKAVNANKTAADAKVVAEAAAKNAKEEAAEAATVLKDFFTKTNVHTEAVEAVKAAQRKKDADAAAVGRDDNPITQAAAEASNEALERAKNEAKTANDSLAAASSKKNDTQATLKTTNAEVKQLNDAYEKAKTDAVPLDAALKNAKDVLKGAKDALEKADNAYKEANKAKEVADKAHEEANNALTKANTEVTAANNALNKANTEVTTNAKSIIHMNGSAFMKNDEPITNKRSAIREIDSKYLTDFMSANRRFVERFSEIVEKTSSAAEFESIKADKAKIFADWIVELEKKDSSNIDELKKEYTGVRKALVSYITAVKNAYNLSTFFYNWIVNITEKTKGFDKLIYNASINNKDNTIADYLKNAKEYEEKATYYLKNAEAYEEKAQKYSIADFSMNTPDKGEDISPSDEQTPASIDYTKIENIVTTSVKTLDKVIQLYSHEHTKIFLKNYNEILEQLKKVGVIYIYNVYDIFTNLKKIIDKSEKHTKFFKDAITATKEAITTVFAPNDAKTQITNYSTTDIQKSMGSVRQQIESIHKELNDADKIYQQLVKNITDKFKNVKPPLNPHDNDVIKTFKYKNSLNKDDLELLRIFIKKYNFYLPQKDNDKNLYTELNNELFNENMMMNYVRGMLSEYDDKEITTRIKKNDDYSKIATIKEQLAYINNAEDLKTTVENYPVDDNFKIVYNKYKDSLMNDVLKNKMRFTR